MKLFRAFIENLYLSENNTEFEVATLNGREYVNNLLGLSFTLPSEWHIIKLEKFKQVYCQQKLQQPFEQYKKELYDQFNNPFLICTKYNPDTKDHDGIITPIINFTVEAKTGDLNNITLQEYAEKLAYQCDAEYPMLKNFKILNRGEIFTQSYHNFILYNTEYLFEHPDLVNGIMVELNVLNIELEDFFLDFSMTHCKAQNEIETEVFNNFVKSIHIY